MADATTQSTFEQIKALVKPIGEEGVAILAAADLGARRLFNRSLKILCDEADAMGNGLTPSEVGALIKAGRFEAALDKNRAAAGPPLADAEMPVAIQP